MMHRECSMLKSSFVQHDEAEKQGHQENHKLQGSFIVP